MVKSSGGRSKGKGASGGGGGGGGSAPTSPTRRLKKGGKRGRRLCHMDGCTLCPSFGFEGDVAVSCSHHKEDGMRNLTARRCQHDGCFTVANFGFPGDKPGFCAAHSTDGMVNRNKPRGSESLLSGMPAARSSRRATKANGSAEAAKAAAAAAATAAAAAAAVPAAAAGIALAISRSSSGGKDLLLRAGTSRKGGGGMTGHQNGGGPDSAVARPAAAGQVRSSGRRRAGGGRDKNGNSSDGEESAGLERAKIAAGERASSKPPSLLVPFVPRGDDDLEAAGPGPSAAAPAARPAGAAGVPRTGGGSGRVRPRGGSKGLGAAAVTAGMLHRQEAAFLSVESRGGREMDDFQRRYAGGGGGGGMLLGAGNRAGRTGMELGLHGDPKRGGVMDASFLTAGGSFLGNDGGGGAGGGGGGGGGTAGGIDNGQEGLRSMLLGTDADSPEANPGDADDEFAARGSDGSKPPPSGAQGVPSPHHEAAGRGSGPPTRSGSFESVIPGGGGGEDGVGGPAGVFLDFGLDHLPELNSNDLTGLRAAETSAHIPRQHQQQQQQQHREYDAAHAAHATHRSGFQSFVAVRRGSGTSSLLASSSVVSDDLSSEVLSSSDGSSSVSVAAAATTGAGGPGAPGAGQAWPAATAASGSGSGGDALVPTKMPTDEAWWDILEREEFVAMPEPAWEVALETQHNSMDQEPSTLRGDGRGWQRSGGGGGGCGGGGGASRSGMAGNENKSSAGLAGGDDELGSSTHGSGRNGGGGGGAAAATPNGGAKARYWMSSSSASGAVGLGGVLVMPGDEGFAGDVLSGRGNRRRNGEVDHHLRGGVYRAGGSAGGGGEGCGGDEGGDGGGRLSPAAKKFAGPSRENNTGGFHAFPSAFRPGAPANLNARASVKQRELVSSSSSSISSSAGGGIFSSAASSSPNGVYPAASAAVAAAPVLFGLTVTPLGGGHPQQIPLPHGGVGLGSAAQGQQQQQHQQQQQQQHLHHHHHQQQQQQGLYGVGSGGGGGGGSSNGSLSRAWMSGDAWSATAGGGDATLSPSKCLSLSPVKTMGMSTSPSSSALPPWGAGPLCSPQQTRAAGLA